MNKNIGNPPEELEDDFDFHRKKFRQKAKSRRLVFRKKMVDSSVLM